MIALRAIPRFAEVDCLDRETMEEHAISSSHLPPSAQVLVNY